MNKGIFLVMLMFFQAAEVKADNYRPVARIESPKNYSNFKHKEEITFKGKATDIEDGDLSGEALVWTSDIDGRIGQGNSFSAVLSQGSHIVILTATDSGYSAAMNSIFITIGTPHKPIDEVEKPKEEKPKPEKPKVEKLEFEKQSIPSIAFLFVPLFGSFENLQGQILNTDPNKFAVAVYTMVEGVWFSKPSLEKPVTKINKEGKWTCDITTAENDELAIKIAAYLIPIDYQPPLASGEFWILKEIEEKCLAKIEVIRKIRSEPKSKPEIKKPEIKKEIPKKTKQPVKKPAKAKKDGMERYFPLAVGNSWKYKKTVYKSDDVFCYTEQTLLESVLGLYGRNPTKGSVYFSVGRSIEKMLQNSVETYTITSKIENKSASLWRVKVEGTIPRDGRYTSVRTKNDPNVRWKYVDEGVLEIMDGKYFGAETRNQTWMVVLTPNIIISSTTKEEKPPFWAIGAVLTEEKIITPTGGFSNCLKNCTIIEGKNLVGVLFKNESPKYSGPEDNFGNFMTISYYAKNVGLIKEIQYDSKGEITYQLELVEYNVN